jgi:phage protein D
MADRPLYASSAPVVKVDGSRVPDLARDLLRLDVEEDIGGLRTIALHVVASAPRATPTNDVAEYLDGSVLDFGKKLEVSMGPPGNEKIVFTGKISALEASFEEGDVPNVTVLAEDDLMALRMTQRSSTYRNVSDGDVAQQLADQHGLRAEVAAKGPTYDVVQQLNQSDLAFLRDRAARVNAELWVDDGALYFATRDQRRGTTITLTQGSNLVAASVRADLAHQCTAVSVSGYDAQQRDRVDVEGSSSVVSAEASGGRTGPDVLQQAFGELAGRQTRMVPFLDAEARAFAEAEMLRRARGFVTVEGTTDGSPEMVVGSRVTLARVGKPFDGNGYYVTRFHHTYDLARGHRTHFRAERPTVGAGQ